MQDLLQWQWRGRFMSHVARTTTRWISTNASPGQCFSTKKSRSEEKVKEKDMKEKLRESWGKARQLLKFKLLLLTVFIAD